MGNGTAWIDPAYQQDLTRGPNLDQIPSTLGGQLSSIWETRGEFTANMVQDLKRWQTQFGAYAGVKLGIMDPEQAKRHYKLLDIGEINDRVRPLGMSFQTPMTEDALQDIINSREKQLAHDLVHKRARAGGYHNWTWQAWTGIAEFLVTAADPINAASMLFPPLGEARFVAALAQARPHAAAFTRGFLENAVWSTVLEVPSYYGQRDRDPDWGLADSILNIAMGSTIGGGVHWLGSYDIRGKMAGLFERTEARVSGRPAAPAPRVLPDILQPADIHTRAPVTPPPARPETTFEGLGAWYEPSRWGELPIIADARFMGFAPPELEPVVPRVTPLAEEVGLGELHRAVDRARLDPYRETDVDAIVERSLDPLDTMQHGAEQRQQLSAETRAAIIHAGMGQVLDNRRLDVETIERTDPNAPAQHVATAPPPATATLEEATAQMREAIADATKPTPVPVGWQAPLELLRQAQRIIRNLPALATRTVERRRQSLAQFVRAEGGIRPESAYADLLAASDIGGLSGLVRKDGMTVEQMALHATEGDGFFPEWKKVDDDGQVSIDADPKLFIDALIADAEKAQQRYRPGDPVEAEFEGLQNYNANVKALLAESGVHPQSLSARELAWILSHDPGRREYEALARAVNGIGDSASQRLMARLDQQIAEAQFEEIYRGGRMLDEEAGRTDVELLPEGSEPMTPADFDRLWDELEDYDTDWATLRFERGLEDAHGRDAGGPAEDGTPTAGLVDRQGDVADRAIQDAQRTRSGSLEDQAATEASGLRRDDEGTGLPAGTDGRAAEAQPAGGELTPEQLARDLAAADGPTKLKRFDAGKTAHRDSSPAHAYREYIARATEELQAARAEAAAAPPGGEPPATPRPREDVGAEGRTQTVLPGAERITDRELAERRMQQPLRGGREAPGGLFDEGARAQGDIFDVRAEQQAARLDVEAHDAYMARQGKPSQDMHADLEGFKIAEADTKTIAARADAEKDFNELQRVVGELLTPEEKAAVEAVGKDLDEDAKAVEVLASCGFGGGGGGA